ncbi:MAG: HEAT repeat domain-containing protein [Candidatus Hodarchaeota archaeon]
MIKSFSPLYPHYEIQTEILTRFGTPAMEKLVKALGDKTHMVRAYSALILGKMGVQEAINPLLKLLNDEVYTVREKVLETLRLLKRIPRH